MVQSDNSRYMTLDLNIVKQPSSQLGIVFKQEFILGKYKHCVMVETVIPNSPAYLADVRKNDILLAIDGKTVTSLNHAAKLLKNAGERFGVRVERVMSHKVQQQEGAKEKDPLEKVRCRHFDSIFHILLSNKKHLHNLKHKDCSSLLESVYDHNQPER